MPSPELDPSDLGNLQVLTWCLRPVLAETVPSNHCFSSGQNIQMLQPTVGAAALSFSGLPCSAFCTMSAGTLLFRMASLKGCCDEQLDHSAAWVYVSPNFLSCFRGISEAQAEYCCKGPKCMP